MGPAALIVAAGVSAAGAIGGAVIAGSAAKKAAGVQAAAADRAAANSRAMYDQTRADLSPYRDLGNTAMPIYKNLLGMGPGGTGAIESTLENLPGYQFTRDQGLKAVQNSYAAQGLATSGPALKGAGEFATGLASGTYNNMVENYLKALTLGDVAAGQTTQAGLTSAAQENQAITASGAAQASGIVGAANATVGGIGAAVGGISNALLLPAMMGSMGGASGLYAPANAFPGAPTAGYTPW